MRRRNDIRECTTRERCPARARIAHLLPTLLQHGKVFTLLMLVAGCASDWGRNRQADLTEAFNVSITSYSLGAQGNVGPVGVGLLYFGSHGSLAHKLGLGGLAEAARRGGSSKQGYR